MAEAKTLEDSLINDIKPFQQHHHPIFKDTLLELQKDMHKYNEIKKRLNRIWRFIFTNEKYDTNYVFGKKGTVSLINYEKKIAIVLTVTSSVRNKEVSIERLNKFSEENPNYKLVYAVLNAPTEEYKVDNVFCLSGDKVLTFILGDQKQAVLNEIKQYIQKVA